MKQARSAKDGPFCYQTKATRRRIREAFDATNNVMSALSVYDALTEIASDSASEEFTTTHAWISRISGASIRTVQAHLRVFCELGLVEVSTPALRAPSKYRLLSFSNDCTTSGNGCAAFGNSSFQPSLPTSEEEEKKDIEKRAEETAARAARCEVVEVPASLNTPEFLSAWSTWKAHRREIRHPLKATSEKAALKHLESIGAAKAIAMIEYTIFKGWRGLADPDEQQTRTAGGKHTRVIDPRFDFSSPTFTQHKDSATSLPVSDGPDGWREWVAKHHPDSVYGPRGARYTTEWKKVDGTAQSWIREQMRKTETPF